MFTIRSPFAGRYWANESSQRSPEFLAAEKRYGDHLASCDLSGAGALLQWFGHDFFDDATVLGFSYVDDIALDVHLRLGVNFAFTESGQRESASLAFTVTFKGVAWLTLECAGTCGAWICGAFEIDGLADQIELAKQRQGHQYHSLVVQGNEQCNMGWAAMVFQSVRVQPEDPMQWVRLLRQCDERPRLYYTTD